MHDFFLLNQLFAIPYIYNYINKTNYSCVKQN